MTNRTYRAKDHAGSRGPGTLLLWLFFGLAILGLLVKPWATFMVLLLLSPVLLILSVVWFARFLTGRNDPNNSPERSALWTLIEGLLP